jgi:hypothetical protein
MGRILEAIGWTGTGYTVILFVVTSSPTPLSLDFETETVHPSSVRIYILEDENQVLGGLHTHEYDLRFEELPRELGLYLGDCLRQACTGGAGFAWLAFEGSFNFDYILNDQVADQIYGICAAGSEPIVVLDDAIQASSAWKDELSRLREAVWRSNGLH